MVEQIRGNGQVIDSYSSVLPFHRIHTMMTMEGYTHNNAQKLLVNQRRVNNKAQCCLMLCGNPGSGAGN